jgi:hypothetical protein
MAAAASYAIFKTANQFQARKFLFDSSFHPDLLMLRLGWLVYTRFYTLG